MTTLLLIRGLPGAGKTTYASKWVGAVEFNRLAFSADDWMKDGNGRYVFQAANLPVAHARCQHAARAALATWCNVAVANTFSRRWEMQPYLDMAKELGAVLQIIDLFDAGLTDAELAARCVHGVPVDAIARMRARWEP